MDGATLAVEYFDGRSARAHPVLLSRHGDALHVDGDGIQLVVPLREVQWPERTRHGVRVAPLPGGASLHGADADAWDAFARACGGGDSVVVRAQQSWRGVLASLAGLVLVVAATYHWGVPWAARAAVPLIPQAVDTAVGTQALETIDAHLLKPSQLPPARQQALRSAFASAVAAQPAGTVPPHRLLFRAGEIGPNAFALPGGTVVVTDDLVERFDDAVVVGVLGHELGHVRHRHGMRLLVQATAIGIVASAVLGDFNTLLSAVPLWIGQAAYARDAEREADVDAAHFLRNAGISPAVMVTFFERVRADAVRRAGEAASAPPAAAASAQGPRGDPRAETRSWLGIAIASHPADAERIRYFEAEATRR